MAEIYDLPLERRRETEVVERLIEHIKFLKKQNNQLEDVLKKANSDKLGYVEGYLDGVGDAAERVEAATTLSHLLKVYKDLLLKDLRSLQRTATEGDITAANLAVNERGDPF